jgi:hypothetical protein
MLLKLLRSLFAVLTRHRRRVWKPHYGVASRDLHLVPLTRDLLMGRSREALAVRQLVRVEAPFDPMQGDTRIRANARVAVFVPLRVALALRSGLPHHGRLRFDLSLRRSSGLNRALV